MFWPGSQKFWRLLPGCGVPFPSTASGSGSQRFARAVPGCCVPFPSTASGPGQPGACVHSPPGAAHLFSLLRAAQVARGLAPSPLARCAFSLCGELPGQPEAWCPLHGCAAPFPSVLSGLVSQRLEAFSPGAVRLFPPQPQRAPPVGSQEVFRQEPGPVCRVGGVGFSGVEFAPFPSPLPPTSSRDGAVLLWSFSVPLFCKPTAVCSGQLIFPRSPTV